MISCEKEELFTNKVSTLPKIIKNDSVVKKPLKKMKPKTFKKKKCRVVKSSSRNS